MGMGGRSAPCGTAPGGGPMPPPGGIAPGGGRPPPLGIALTGIAPGGSAMSTSSCEPALRHQPDPRSGEAEQAAVEVVGRVDLLGIVVLNVLADGCGIDALTAERLERRGGDLASRHQGADLVDGLVPEGGRLLELALSQTVQERGVVLALLPVGALLLQQPRLLGTSGGHGRCNLVGVLPVLR